MTTDPHAIQPAGDAHHEHHITDAHGTSTSGHPAEPAPFTIGEIEEFRHSDRGVGAVIILLMAGIFVTGLFLYTIVALVTYRS